MTKSYPVRGGADNLEQPGLEEALTPAAGCPQCPPMHPRHAVPLLFADFLRWLGQEYSK